MLIPSALVHPNRCYAGERVDCKTQHPRKLAATICSYHRLQYTQTATMPVRESIFDGLEMRHLLGLAATMCSYHRLQHTQSVDMPLRDTTCTARTYHEFGRLQKVEQFTGNVIRIPKTRTGYLDQKQTKTKQNQTIPYQHDLRKGSRVLFHDIWLGFPNQHRPY